MVHDNKGGTSRRKGWPGGEAPEGQAQSTSGQAHGSGHSLKQKQEIAQLAQARMKALQHTEVPSSSTSSTSKTAKAQGKQPSQPKRGMTSSVTDHPAELATDQATATESASASAAAESSSASVTASVLESALGAASQDMGYHTSDSGSYTDILTKLGRYHSSG